jgi:hypothetical protein
MNLDIGVCDTQQQIAGSSLTTSQASYLFCIYKTIIDLGTYPHSALGLTNLRFQWVTVSCTYDE